VALQIARRLALILALRAAQRAIYERSSRKHAARRVWDDNLSVVIREAERVLTHRPALAAAADSATRRVRKRRSRSPGKRQLALAGAGAAALAVWMLERPRHAPHGPVDEPGPTDALEPTADPDPVTVAT
jgi:hypothetical protein